MSFLDNPAYKVRIQDLKNAQGAEDQWTLKIRSQHVDGVPEVESHLPPTEKTLKLTLLWVQGTVTDVVPGQAQVPPCLKISDSGNDEAVIYEYLGIPGGNHPSITKGAYIGVLGQLWLNKPTVVIKAAKIMYLSNPQLKILWPDEIKMDRAYLLGLMKPDLESQ